MQIIKHSNFVNLRAITLSVMLLFMSTYLFLASRNKKNEKRMATFVLNRMLPDVELEIVNTLPGVHPRVAFSEIRLRQNSSTRPLLHLNQLAGLIHITTDHEALNFVRLRNSAYTYIFWNNKEPLELEITSFREFTNISSYGLKPRDISSDWQSGWLGIMKDTDFFREGYSHASVEKNGYNFLVVRWIIDSTGSVKRVMESVGSDGQYSRKILSSSSIPPHSKLLSAFPPIL